MKIKIKFYRKRTIKFSYDFSTYEIINNIKICFFWYYSLPFNFYIILKYFPIAIKK